MKFDKKDIFKATLCTLIGYGLISLFQAYLSRNQVSYTFGSRMHSSLAGLARSIWFEKYLYGGWIGFFYIVSGILAFKWKKAVYAIFLIAGFQVSIFLILLKISFVSWGCIVIPLAIVMGMFYDKLGLERFIKLAKNDRIR